MKALRTIIMLIGLLIVIFGCEDQYMTQSADVSTNAAGQTMRLSATPDNLDITAGGAVTIMIEFYAEDGSGIEGSDIVVTSSNGTLGANVVTTDENGVAVTTLVGGSRPGYAVVVSTYGSLQCMVSVDFYEGDSDSGGSTENPDIDGDDTAA